MYSKGTAGSLLAMLAVQYAATLAVVSDRTCCYLTLTPSASVYCLSMLQNFINFMHCYVACTAVKCHEEFHPHRDLFKGPRRCSTTLRQTTSVSFTCTSWSLLRTWTDSLALLS